MKKEKRPVLSISFSDLRRLGFEVEVEEFEKKIPAKDDEGNSTTINKQSVKVNKVTRYGKLIPKHDMIEFLWLLGIDTKEQRFWVRPKQTHRPLLRKNPVEDYRYMGYERIDTEWIQSGRASDDVMAFSSNMEDMAEELRKLRCGG